MKKNICKKEYDTENGIVVKKVTYGNFGDPQGYEETLYQTSDGFYFLYVNGGMESIHPCEDIQRMGRTKATTWLEHH